MRDYNLDLLKATSATNTLNYFENITSSEFAPLVTLPTRVTGSSHTLIDNVYANNKRYIRHLL